MLITIPFGFLRKYGPKVWRDIDRYEEIVRSGKVSPQDEVGPVAPLSLQIRLIQHRPDTCDSTQPRTVLNLIVKTYMPPSGKRIGAPRRLYIAVLLLWSVCFPIQFRFMQPL